MVKSILKDCKGFYALTSVSRPALLLQIIAQIDKHKTQIMIDCVMKNNFVSLFFVDRIGFTVKKKEKVYNLIAIDKNLLLEQKKIDSTTEPLSMTIQHHYEVITFDIIAMAKHNIVFEIPWLYRHNPMINWKAQILKFDKCNCIVMI